MRSQQQATNGTRSDDFLVDGRWRNSRGLQVFGIAHTAVADVSAVMQRTEKRYNYVTPTAFINLVQGYVKTLATKQEEIGGSRDKLANGLFKLNEARTQVEEMTIDHIVTIDAKTDAMIVWRHAPPQPAHTQQSAIRNSIPPTTLLKGKVI